MKRILFLFAALNLMASCNTNKSTADGSGTFEADEVIVSSELNGRILQLNVHEGDTLSKGIIAAVIDASNLELQKEQVEASINSF